MAAWAPMKTHHNSSARVELAALVIAATANMPVRVGIDNKSVVDKATTLINIARNVEALPNGAYPRRPLKKPFVLQTDGDLWGHFWLQLQIRGPRSICVQKVKGHATEKAVALGEVTE